MPEFMMAAVAIPLIAAALRRDRSVAIAAAALSLGCVAVSAPSVTPVAALPMLVFAGLVLAVLIAAPKSEDRSGLLVLLAGSLTVYSASNLIVLFLGWAVSAWPVLRRTEGSRLPRIAVGASVVLLGAGLLLMSVAPAWAFGLVVLAAVIRKGLFPFHTWVVAAFSDGPLLLFGLLLNAHLGAFVIARVAILMMPEYSRDALTLISALALISSIYAAFAGLGERNPRRSLALLMISQSSFILAGLESRNAEGITGALTFWVVVATATMGLLIVYRALESRCAEAADKEFAGLATSAPRMAAFFAVCGLALVGLPGTLGFAAEDLLFHGALEGHHLLGVALPLATALNAINVYRLFSSLFFGRRRTLVPVFPDALGRERLALSAVVLFLVAGGLLPRIVVSSRVAPAEAIATVLAGADSHPDH